jgi:hypothetical protein
VQIDNFTVNGKRITVTGQPNQLVTIAGTDCYLILNEQSSISKGNSADIGVAAIRFNLCHCITGHMGFVHVGITANGVPPPEEEHSCGKVTGGGWILTEAGAKGTFGMSGGIRRGEFWGHLTYVDHNNQMKVESSEVTGFEIDPKNPNAATITYAVTITGLAGGVPGTATLRVVDNGEPGRDDIFDLTLSTGYHASGALGTAKGGGGNIQMHKCPPGWE